MFALTPSPRPTFLLEYTSPHLSTKPQLFHPLLPVSCGAMGVPFDALYDIGITITITTTTIPLESTGCNHISRFVGFPNPRPLGLRIRVLHLSRNEYWTTQYTCFLCIYEQPNKHKPKPQAKHNATATSPTPTIFFVFGFFGTFLPQNRGAGWGGGAQRARETR